MNKPIGTFVIAETFNITGRGIVLAGKIIEGTVNPSNILEFQINNKLISRKVVSMDLINSQFDKIQIGIIMR